MKTGLACDWRLAVILPFKRDGSACTDKDFTAFLYDSPSFGGVKITRCHLWRPEGSPPNAPGCLFVDFNDDKMGTALKCITCTHHRIGDNFYSCRETCSMSMARPAPLCGSCARWGHINNQCSSRWSHCPICADNHHTADHNTVTKDVAAKCYNCSEAHAATSTDCVFFAHWTDHKWLFNNTPKYDYVKHKMVYFMNHKVGEAKKSGAT